MRRAQHGAGRVARYRPRATTPETNHVNNMTIISIRYSNGTVRYRGKTLLLIWSHLDPRTTTGLLPPYILYAGPRRAGARRHRARSGRVHPKQYVTLPRASSLRRGETCGHRESLPVRGASYERGDLRVAIFDRNMHQRAPCLLLRGDK